MLYQKETEDFRDNRNEIEKEVQFGNHFDGEFGYEKIECEYGLVQVT
jgi:hypothetical protein